MAPWNIWCPQVKVFKPFNVWPKKLNHVFNDDKYYCLFFIYTKQPSLSSSMTVRKTLHIKAEQNFLDAVYTEV